MEEQGTKSRTGKKVRIGQVVSAKMDKTVVVAVEELTKHPRFKKYIRRRTKLYAHDKDNQCEEGDLVEVIESRPLSALKRWRVRRIIKKAEKV